MKREPKGESKIRRLVIYRPETTYKGLWHSAIDVDKTASGFIADLIEQYLKASEKGKRG